MGAPAGTAGPPPPDSSSIRFPLGTALYEEVAFRGVLGALWTRRSGERTARTVAAAAFGAWHILPTVRLYPDMAGGRSRGARR
jgi:membrane protease YdiL (CAAX protease family)